MVFTANFYQDSHFLSPNVAYILALVYYDPCIGFVYCAPNPFCTAFQNNANLAVTGQCLMHGWSFMCYLKSNNITIMPTTNLQASVMSLSNGERVLFVSFVCLYCTSVDSPNGWKYC